MNLESFQRAYDKYFKLSRKIAMDILYDYHLAGDVAQEVFTMMYLKRDELDEEKVKYWIVLNTNRRALDIERKPYYTHEVAMDEVGIKMCDSLTNEPVRPDEMILRHETCYFQKSALDLLREHREEWYEILVRYHVDGESYPSLAQRYSKTTKYIRVEASRARRWLDKKVREMYE